MVDKVELQPTCIRTVNLLCPACTTCNAELAVVVSLAWIGTQMSWFLPVEAQLGTGMLPYFL